MREEHRVAPGGREPGRLSVVVLGTAQDGGRPQVGCHCTHCQAARRDPALVEGPSALAVIDDVHRQMWLVDVTPAFPQQFDGLETRLGAPYALAGAIITHAHIGHYLGLAHLGREVMGAHGVPVWVSPAMARFLTAHAPWSQLVQLGNIRLERLEPDAPHVLAPGLSATLIPVPHRNEHADTMAVVLEGPTRRLLYLPDIDRWEPWADTLAQVLPSVDVALLDGTFYDADELPGRNRQEIPHPPVVDTLARLALLRPLPRTEIYVTHLNHSNRLWDPVHAEALAPHGVRVARRGDQHEL